MNKVFAGREPALLITLAGIVIKLIGAFFIDFNVTQQSACNALVAAGVGLGIAYNVHDGMSAAVLGFAQALLALALGFGVHLPADTQTLLMSFVAIAIGMFERTQVTAPVPPERVP